MTKFIQLEYCRALLNMLPVGSEHELPNGGPFGAARYKVVSVSEVNVHGFAKVKLECIS
jgi:hypothetical protein